MVDFPTPHSTSRERTTQLPRLWLIAATSLFGLMAACGKPARPQAAIAETIEFTRESTPESKTALKEVTFDSMPTKGSVKTRVWNAFYWPTQNDGILARYLFAKQDPIEKFEQAFGAAISASQPDYDKGDLHKSITKSLIPDEPPWAGICHGSATVSEFFAEPLRSVEINNVVFSPFEIKGLLSYFVAQSSNNKILFWGSRNNNLSAKEVARLRESKSRMDSPQARDMNPGLFHQALTTILGSESRPVIFDLISGLEVLNFPAHAFEVLSSQDVTNREEYTSLPGVSSTAAKLIKVTTRVTFVDNHRVTHQTPGSLYTFDKIFSYLIEQDDKGFIIGGEWLEDSRKDHPDFAYITLNPDASLVTYSDLKLGLWLSQLANMSHDLTRTPTAAELENDASFSQYYIKDTPSFELEGLEDFIPTAHLVK